MSKSGHLFHLITSNDTTTCWRRKLRRNANRRSPLKYFIHAILDTDSLFKGFLLINSLITDRKKWRVDTRSRYKVFPVLESFCTFYLYWRSKWLDNFYIFQKLPLDALSRSWNFIFRLYSNQVTAIIKLFFSTLSKKTNVS